MKKIIARISNGFGNQMFLYASSFAISKDLNRNLELDIFSGIISLTKKNKKKKFKHFVPRYELDIFNISAKITSKENCFDTFFKQIKRKILKLTDFFSKRKFFIIEHKNAQKITFFKKIDSNIKLYDKAYLEGYFESEKYFKKYRNELIKEFSFKKKIPCVEIYKDKILNTNSVSLAMRADRYNETLNDDLYKFKVLKSKSFEDEQFDYVLRSINYFKSKIQNPVFFLFSDNIDKIKKLFLNNSDVFFISEFAKDKIQEDFYLMSKCKHFAVAPTSFHYWAAWLSENKNKICLRPKNINPSNNLDFWPKSWIEI